MDAMNTWSLVIGSLAALITIIGAMAAMLRFQLRAIEVRLDARFQSSDAKFDTIDKRFDAIEHRFEAIDQRFEDVDKRFDQLDEKFTTRFADADQKELSRFEALEAKLDAQAQITKIGFDSVEHRLGTLESDMHLVKAHLLGRPDAA